MMDNTPAKNCRKRPTNRHIRPPFSPFYLRKCLTNSGRYILSQVTEENSNAICSLNAHCNTTKTSGIPYIILTVQTTDMTYLSC